LIDILKAPEESEMPSDNEAQQENNCDQNDDGSTEELSSKLLLEQCVVSDDEKHQQKTGTNTLAVAFSSGNAWAPFVMEMKRGLVLCRRTNRLQAG